MAQLDQDARKIGDYDKVEEVDQVNTERLKQILREHGWPKISVYGPQAARAAWLIAQHSTLDRDFQKQCLEMMKDYLPAQEVDPVNVAYLEDRVSIYERGIQVYGTQGQCVGDVFTISSTIDEFELNERRAKIGLMPIEEYIQKSSRFLCQPEERVVIPPR